jgi:hypothetical protein
VFDRFSGQLRFSFYAYDRGFRGGVSVALADVTGDGVVDIVMGTGPGGGPLVETYSGATGQSLGRFLAMDPGFRGGVNVAATEAGGTGRAEVVVAAGSGGGPRVSVLDGRTGAAEDDFVAVNPAFLGGLAVAVAPR